MFNSNNRYVLFKLNKRIFNNFFKELNRLKSLCTEMTMRFSLKKRYYIFIWMNTILELNISTKCMKLKMYDYLFS